MTRLDADLAHPAVGAWLDTMCEEGVAWGEQLPELMARMSPRITCEPARSNEVLGELERRGVIVRGRLDPHDGLGFILGLGRGGKQTPEGVMQRARAFCMDLLCYAWHPPPTRKLALKRSKRRSLKEGGR